jgi:AraC family transcriptional regulator
MEPTRTQPKFVELPEIKLVGLGTKFISVLSPQKNNAKVLPKLWHDFVQLEDQIPHHLKAGRGFGVVEMLPKEAAKSNPGEMFYIAATEVSEIGPLPAGMISRTIPAGRYAQFTHKGKLDGLEKTMKYIYTEWLPTGQVELRHAPHLEIYDNRFNPASDTSEFDFLLPVNTAK